MRILGGIWRSFGGSGVLKGQQTPDYEFPKHVNAGEACEESPKTKCCMP